MYNYDKIRQALGEIVVALDKIQAQNDQIKSITETMKDIVDPVILKRTAKALQKDKRQEEIDKTSAFLEILEVL